MQDPGGLAFGVGGGWGSGRRDRYRTLCRFLEKLPLPAYTCDAAGLITFFNQHAVQLWGRAPGLNSPDSRFCGSFKLWRPTAHADQP